ncbi:hypothetical protein [Robbsia sp. KACC 23696]|uniref:hypothetical protein n=1 Tax=Robbsia sp. KACC 23696 TaxID=3149231 RepID=UPI00325C2D50
MSEYIIVCVKDSIKERHFITLWRPNNSGYTAVIDRAGRYTAEQVIARLDYYNDGDNVAVPASLIAGLGVQSPARWFDYPGACVLSTRENWARIKAEVIARPANRIKPEPVGKQALALLNARYANDGMTRTGVPA